MGVNDRQNRTILFVHIPKTAGTTLRVMLEEQYSQQPWFVIHHDIQAERRRFEGAPDSDRSAYRMVFGHMAWGWHSLLPEGRAYAYTTMLRDPVERVLSLYSHSKVEGHYLWQAVNGMDIERWLESGVTQTADNGMVRQLCGRDKFLQKPWADMEIPLGGVTEIDLLLAVKHLDQCALVGLAEHFDAYLREGRHEFGWRMGGYRRENVARWPRLKQEDLTAKQLAAVRKWTELDRVLYEHALKVGAK